MTQDTPSPRSTIQNFPTVAAGLTRPRLRLTAWLTAVHGTNLEQVQIRESKTYIGRSNEATISLASDASVSRLHACITRTPSDEFVLDDLDSSNGTFVDGVPIQSCILRNGDIIQIGRSLFYFDRLFEIIGQTEVLGRTAATGKTEPNYRNAGPEP